MKEREEQGVMGLAGEGEASRRQFFNRVLAGSSMPPDKDQSEAELQALAAYLAAMRREIRCAATRASGDSESSIRSGEDAG